MKDHDSVDFMQARKELDEFATAVLAAKGQDYAGQKGSRYNNFILLAALLSNFSVPPDSAGGVWAVYFLKHVFAILAWIGQGTSSESLTSRIIDARNYLDLLHGMSREGLVAGGQSESTGKATGG